MLGGGNTAKQQVPGIRTLDAAGLSFAIERDRVVAQARKPESLFDPLAQALCTRPPPAAALGLRSGGSELRHRLERRAGVALHFDHRNGSFGNASIRVKDRILAVFPRLVGQAGFLAAHVVQETRAALLEPPLDPLGR